MTFVLHTNTNTPLFKFVFQSCRKGGLGICMFQDIFFTKGVGVHREKLASFENALRNARIAHLNLVMVSSIFPPHCKILISKQVLSRLEPGEITHCVMAREQINEAGRRVVASVGLAIPAEPGRYGYLSNITASGRQSLRPGNMPKIWPPPCLPTRWALNSIRTKTTTNAGRFTA